MKKLFALLLTLAMIGTVLCVTALATDVEYVNAGKTLVIQGEDFDEAEATGDLPDTKLLPNDAMFYDASTDTWEYFSDVYDEAYSLSNTWRPGSTLYYNVEIPKAGTYHLVFRASTRQNVTAVIHLEISANGTDYTPLVDSKEFPDTFSMNPDATNPYHNYIELDAANDVELPAGKVTFKMTFTNYPDVDFFTLSLADGSPLIEVTPTPAPTATPEPTATPAPTTAPTATPEPTAVPTLEPTAAPATEAPEQTSGCGSLVSLSLLAALPALACVIRKKH